MNTTSKRSRNMRKIFLVLSVAILSVFAYGKQVSLETKGSGETRRLAIREALAVAIQQKTGVVISTDEAASFVENAQAQTSTGKSAYGEQRIADSLNRDISVKSSGRISGFEILSEERDPQTGEWTVNIIVYFPDDKYVVGLDPENRRRLAIIDFRVVGNTYSWMGQEGSTVDWSRSLTDKLNVRFTKTRRFTMLERKFLAEINDELAGLSDANIAPGEIVRRCQRLATDYLVVGEVKFYPVAAPTVNPYTGRAMPMGSQLFAEVNYRVVLAATGQLKFADIVKIDAASFVAATIGAFESETTDAAASLIIDGILANYKLRDAANDGTEGAETAVDTVNRTPILQYVEPPAATTIRGNGTGGIVTPF